MPEELDEEILKGILNEDDEILEISKEHPRRCLTITQQRETYK